MRYINVNFFINYKIFSINYRYFENVNLCGVKIDFFKYVFNKKNNIQLFKENYNIQVFGLNFFDYIKQFIKGFYKCYFYFFFSQKFFVLMIFIGKFYSNIFFFFIVKLYENFIVDYNIF